MRAVLSDQSQPSRLIRVTAVEDMGAHLLPEVIAMFSKRYPLLRFELVLSNEQLNLIRDGIDIAIRVGKLPQTSYRTRNIGSVGFVLVASARYRDRFPNIALADLASHPLLALPSYSQKNRTLYLVKGADEARAPIVIRATATNTAALLKMVQLDLGIGLLPDFLCREGLAEGSLVRLCPGWQTPPKRVSLVYTAKLPREPVVKELGDGMYEQFRRRLSPAPR
jgi:DNA-binding transcriptional LysR family regulator